MFVQFSDSSQTTVISVFAEPQDPEYWPNQGQVSVDDQRYSDYVARSTPSPLTLAQQERDRLLSIAALAIAPLQDAVDLDDAPEKDIKLLKAWKAYRVAVSRVAHQESYPTEIDWPSSPVTA